MSNIGYKPKGSREQKILDKNYNKIFHQLACPDCNSGDLEEIIESGYLCCKKCNSNFPIIDGNPFLFKRNDLEKLYETEMKCLKK